METDRPTRIVIVGGGFGGVYTVRHLDRLWRGRAEITLISKDNYFLMTPLLFEAGSGVLEPRHAVAPVRRMLNDVRFIEAKVEGIDFVRRVISARLPGMEIVDVAYDHVVIAVGGMTNTQFLRGSENAMTFKTLADGIRLRNHALQMLEQADVEKDAARKKALLTFTVIGAGFVGVELQGELTEFLDNARQSYPNISAQNIRYELIEALPRIAPEFPESLVGYIEKVLTGRGVNVRVNTKVDEIARGRVHLVGGETILSETIIVATGVIPSPLVAKLDLPKAHKGRIDVEATMQVKGRNDVWALGDCATIPDPAGKPYPPLAQHALREAKVLARNITAAIRGGKLEPFVYRTKGLLASLGHFKGAGQVYGVNIHGFFAWWVWRTYYLMQMPRWERKLRVVIDWTLDLIFRNDIVQLDMYDQLDTYERRDRANSRGPEGPGQADGNPRISRDTPAGGGESAHAGSAAQN